TTEQGLVALTTRPAANAAKWNGPYLQRAVPLDPWGKPYQYRSPGEHGEFDLLSFGKDGQPGGSGEPADIKSWEECRQFEVRALDPQRRVVSLSLDAPHASAATAKAQAQGHAALSARQRARM